MLKLENFSICLKEDKIVDLDMMILEAGKKINLISDNNGGKSLILKAIHGDFKKFEGNILLTEKSSAFFKKRKKTILLEQFPYLLPGETVWDNITLPFIKLSNRQKDKIYELTRIAGLKDKMKLKVKHLAYSSQKFIELIRAVIQLPYFILLDDYDCYFDRLSMLKADTICEYALNNGSSVLASSRTRLDNFDIYYKIHLKKLIKL